MLKGSRKSILSRMADAFRELPIKPHVLKAGEQIEQHDLFVRLH